MVCFTAGNPDCPDSWSFFFMASAEACASATEAKVSTLPVGLTTTAFSPFLRSICVLLMFVITTCSGKLEREQASTNSSRNPLGIPSAHGSTRRMIRFNRRFSNRIARSLRRLIKLARCWRAISDIILPCMRSSVLDGARVSTGVMTRSQICLRSCESTVGQSKLARQKLLSQRNLLHDVAHCDSG